VDDETLRFHFKSQNSEPPLMIAGECSNHPSLPLPFVLSLSQQTLSSVTTIDVHVDVVLVVSTAIMIVKYWMVCGLLHLVRHPEHWAVNL